MTRWLSVSWGSHHCLIPGNKSCEIRFLITTYEHNSLVKNNKQPKRNQKTKPANVGFGLQWLLSLQEWAFKPENVCAYTDIVLLPKWGLVSWEAFRWEELELSCHGRAHLDWALGLGWLKTNFPHVQISAKWALKLPSKSPLGNVL